ncbi:MAG: DUF3244 domain-containing protein [Bacteroidaceae bacterium]|nr:DUF3244 domain-containing protein [Bacteroidaceae bacterium]
MKTFLNWLLVAVCLFTVGNAQVMADGGKEVEGVPIPLITGDVLTGSDARDGGIIPFTAYYQGSAIYISTSAEFSAITINVENETTGQEWNSTTDISDGMGEITIINGGAGSYSVEIVTEYGERFVGSFTL